MKSKESSGMLGEQSTPHFLMLKRKKFMLAKWLLFSIFQESFFRSFDQKMGQPSIKRKPLSSIKIKSRVILKRYPGQCILGR
jgi:hypothetical protein